MSLRNWTPCSINTTRTVMRTSRSATVMTTTAIAASQRGHARRRAAPTGTRKNASAMPTAKTNRALAAVMRTTMDRITRASAIQNGVLGIRPLLKCAFVEGRPPSAASTARPQEAEAGSVTGASPDASRAPPSAIAARLSQGPEREMPVPGYAFRTSSSEECVREEAGEGAEDADADEDDGGTETHDRALSPGTGRHIPPWTSSRSCTTSNRQRS